MSLIGKAMPDAAFTTVVGGTKGSLAKTQVKGKSLVLCFTDEKDPTQCKAAIQLMEDNAFKHDKVVFVIVATDSQAAAAARHKDQAVKKCQHVLSPASTKAFGVTRTPFHVVVGPDGKVKYASEEEGRYMGSVPS